MSVEVTLHPDGLWAQWQKRVIGDLLDKVEHVLVVGKLAMFVDPRRDALVDLGITGPCPNSKTALKKKTAYKRTLNKSQ